MIKYFEENYKIINTISELKEILKNFGKTFSVDTEFTDLNFFNNEIIGLSMFDGVTPIYIQFNFKSKYYIDGRDSINKRKKIKIWKNYAKTDAINIKEATPILREFFKNAECITHNGKVELKLLYKLGIWDLETTKITDDSMCQIYCIDPSLPKGLKENSEKYLGIKMESYTDTVLATKKKGELNICWNDVDWQKYGRYGALDSYITWYLVEALTPKLPKGARHYSEIEIPLIPVNAIMELKGVKIDKKYLKKLSIEITKEIAQKENEIYRVAGCKFNINSGDQLGDILFNRLRCPVIKKTDKGKNSTDRETLDELAYQGYKIAEVLQRYSELEKLKSTYIDALPETADADDRIRCNFNALFTVSGRFSSSSPNLQNLPAREKKYTVRKAFIPEKGKVFVSADFGQLEMRMIAHVCKDKALIEAFKNGLDTHQMTADKINSMGLNISRSEGKTANFSIVFGMSATSLAKKINIGFKKLVREGKMTEQELKEKWISQKQAQTIIDGFYELYAGYAKEGQEITARAKRLGYTETVTGFRRYIPELQNKRTYYEGQRYAINTRIQGSAAALVKETMVNIFKEISKIKGANLLLQVHDELHVECYKKDAEKVREIMQRCGETVWKDFLVPLDFETEIFNNWHELKTGVQKEKITKKLQKWNLEVFA